jgi:hypothetical protein
VFQLNSSLGKAVNEFRVAVTTIRDRRAGQDFEPKPFPSHGSHSDHRQYVDQPT